MKKDFVKKNQSRNQFIHSTIHAVSHQYENNYSAQFNKKRYVEEFFHRLMLSCATCTLKIIPSRKIVEVCSIISETVCAVN